MSKDSKVFYYLTLFLILLYTFCIYSDVVRNGRESVLQYHGICLETGRVLSDEEKIALAIQATSKRRIVVYVQEGVRKGFEQAPYSSVDVFLEKNPDCCKIEMREFIKFQKYHSLLPARMNGQYAGHITIKYQAQYIDEKGEIHTTPYGFTTAISNCGKILDPLEY